MSALIRVLSTILNAKRVVLAVLFTTLAFTSFAATLNSTTTQTISTSQTYTGSNTILTGTVTVSSGTTLTFTGSLTVGTGGSLVIQNGAKVIINGVLSIGTSSTGNVTVQNGALLTVNPGTSTASAAISVNSTSATGLDVQSGGAVIVTKTTSGANILGLYETSSSNVNIAGSLQIRGGGFKMDNTAKLTYSGSGNDTIIGAPNATAAYFSNSTVLTVGPNVNLYIDGDTKNDSNANFAINGNVAINGNYQSGNTTANVTGTGTLTTTGSLDADSYQGSVFGQRYSCPTGPCSGNNLISSSNSTPCPTVNFTMSGPSVSGATYQWLSSSSASGTFAAISGATTQNYTTSITATTYYKRAYTVSGVSYNSNTLTITTSVSNPSVYAGSSFSTCAGNSPVVTSNTSVSNVSSVLWTTSGSGTFSASTNQYYSLYTPSSTDIAAGSVLITLTGYASGSCSSVSASSSYTLTINGSTSVTTQPSTSAVTYCQNAASAALSVTTSGSNLTYQWYSNTAASTTSPAPVLISGATNASYAPSTAVVGKLYYFCTVNSAFCTPASTKSNVSGAITVTATPTAVPAISGATSVCAGATTTLTNSLSGGTWSSATTSVATISSSGVVTGITGGTSVISYAGPSTGCYTPATLTMTVLDVPTVVTMTSSGSYTVPANAKAVSIQVWGAGGGGSKGYTNLKGTGGGGGGYAQQTSTVNAGDVIPVTVGTGGIGATVSGNGNNGGTSSATVGGLTISATGGFAGVSTNTPAGTGGLGGSGSNGAYNYTGGGGANINLPYQSNPGGGAGSSAGTSSNGNNAGGTTPGTGTPGGTAVAGGGAGGAGSSASNGDGFVGGFPGGGGGGNAGTGNGGNGANGQVIITVYYTKITYSAPSFCKSASAASPTIVGVTGGTFASTSGLVISSSTGVITPSTSTAGTYTITYSNVCGVISSTVVTILATPTATAGGSQSICQSATATVSGANASNGTIAWTENGFGTLSGATTLTPVYTSTSADAGTTVTLTMTVSNAACSATATYSVIVGTCTNTWTGTTSTAWDLGTNWSLGTIPTSQNDVVIPATLISTRWPVIASGVTATASNITLSPAGTASLIINSTGVLNAYGSILNRGTFTANSGSIVTFMGTATQTIGGVSILYNTTVNNTAGVTLATGAASALTIKGKLLLTKGTLTTNSNLSIDIDAGGNIGYTSGDVGTVSGNVTVFRAVNTITTHYISCPLDGVTMRGLADDAQVINPATNKTRLFQYNASSFAWSAVNDSNAVMAPSSPFSMWFPAATTIDFTGTYNHAASYSTSSSNVANKFMFVSNPYPSSLDWEATGWTKTGIKNAVYFWNPTTNSYTSYVSGQGTNSATQIIPAMNSFFVAYDGNAGTPTATVSMTNSVRSSTYKALWRTAADETVRITLKNSSGAADETVVRFNEAATNEFDDDLDAYKFLNAATVPSIYTVNGSTKYSINSISSAYAKDTIPVYTKIPADGEYVLSIKNSDPTIEYVLVDKKLGTETTVSTKDYSFTALKTDSINRFDLQMRQVEVVATGVQKSSAASGMQILSSPNGFLVKSGLSGAATIEVLDARGSRVNVLTDVSLVNGNNFFTPALSDGIYLVKVTMGNNSYVGQVSIIK